MGFLAGFDKHNRYTINYLEWVGAIALLTMMVVTCVDVMGAKIFLLPVPGSIDIVMLAQVVAISFGTASALILGRHVTVEFFVILLPKRAQAAVEIAMSLLGLFFFAVVVWRLAVYGYYMQSGEEVSPTARIPLYPFAYGVALAAIPVCLVFIAELLNALGRIGEK